MESVALIMLLALPATVSVHEAAQLSVLMCAAKDVDDDKEVLKLAGKLIPLMQEQLKDPAILKEIKGIKGTFAMNVTQDGKPAGSW